MPFHTHWPCARFSLEFLLRSRSDEPGPLTGVAIRVRQASAAEQGAPHTQVMLRLTQNVR